MATIKDWVRSDAAWGWIKQKGYETFQEHDELVRLVDSETVTETELYNEDGINFPVMPNDWKSVEELNAIKEVEMKKFYDEMGIDYNPNEEFKATVITGTVSNDDLKNIAKGKV